MSVITLLWENTPERTKLLLILKERSQEVLKGFRQMTISEFNEPELISIMQDINSYSKDIYRPALTSFSCEMVGGCSSTYEASLMIALITAGMAIKDDIIDKSKYTHYRETIPGRYGIDKALLASDLLLVKGLTTARKLFSDAHSNDKCMDVLEALKNFTFEIYEAELMDISCRKNLNTALDYYSKVVWKLVADGEVCTRIGAILGNGSEAEVKNLSAFGRKLGFILHLVEEVKDTFNVEGSLIHRLKYESVPFPILYASKNQNACVKLKSILKNSLIDASLLEIEKICWANKGVTYVSNIVRKTANEAFELLNSFRPCPARDVLRQMVEVPLCFAERAQEFEEHYQEAFVSETA